MLTEIPTLDELEALLAKATTGPWSAASWEPGEPDRLVCAEPMPSGQKRVLAEMVTYPDAPWTVPGDDNAALIAAARNALPDLLTVVRGFMANEPSPWDDRSCRFCIAVFGQDHHDRCAWSLARKLAGGAP